MRLVPCCAEKSVARGTKRPSIVQTFRRQSRLPFCRQQRNVAEGQGGDTIFSTQQSLWTPRTAVEIGQLPRFRHRRQFESDPVSGPHAGCNLALYAIEIELTRQGIVPFHGLVELQHDLVLLVAGVVSPLEIGWGDGCGDNLS